MDYSKWKKTREGALSKLVQQVTKNGEKGIDSKAVSGYLTKVKHLSRYWRIERLKVSIQDHLNNGKRVLKKKTEKDISTQEWIEQWNLVLASLQLRFLMTSNILRIPSRFSWLQMQELAHTERTPPAKLQGCALQRDLCLGSKQRNLCPASGSPTEALPQDLSASGVLPSLSLPKLLQNT